MKAWPALLLFGFAHAAFAEDVEGQLLQRGDRKPMAHLDIFVDELRVASSDAQGRFHFDTTPGTHTVSIRSEGTEVKTLTVEVPVRKTLKVYLAPELGPLEIVVESFKPSANATRHKVDAEMAFETPGTHDDSVRLVQALPGVVVQREFSPTSGDLSVRASKPGDNRFFLDGIEVPYLYHFNQYASVFPTTQIGALNLYSSTFGAEYGDAIGAVVDAQSRTDRPNALHGGVTFNTIMVGGDVRAPIGEKVWVSGSLRRSYHDIAGESNDQYQLWPRFSDFSARLQTGTQRNGFSMFAFGAKDRYTRAAGELDLLDPVEVDTSPSFSFLRKFEVFGLSHRFDSPAARGRIALAYTTEKRLGVLEGLASEYESTQTLTSRFDIEGRLEDHIDWQGGWELRAESMDLQIEGAGPTGLLVAQEAPGLARGADISTRVKRTRLGGYGQLHVRLGRLGLFPGIRLTHDPMSRQFVVSPRLTSRWQISDQTAIKIAGGHYAQPNPTELLLPETGNPRLELPASWQVTAGIEQTIAHRLELSLDGYQKWLQHPVISYPNRPPESGHSGEIRGLEFVVRYRLREHFFLWGWAGWSYSRLSDAQGNTYTGPYDQPISGGLVASWDISSHWNIALRYRIASGLPYTPVIGGIYDATRDSWSPVPGTLSSARMPLYQKLDASVSYTAIFKKWTLQLRAEMWYVPKSSTQLYPTYNYSYDETEWVTGIPLLPLIGARATF